MSTLSFGKIEVRKASSGQRIFAWIHIVAGFLLAALGAAMIVSLPWSEALQYRAARDWPVAQATILDLKLSELHYADARGTGFVSELALNVTYQFEVAGETVTGTRASFADRTSIDERKLRVLYGRLNFARLMGRTVTVAYHRDDPAIAYLHRGFDWNKAAWRGGLGVLAGLCAAGLMLSGFRARG